MKNQFIQPAVAPTHDTLPDEHINHTLKMQPCLEAKGFLQTPGPSAWGQPNEAVELKLQDAKKHIVDELLTLPLSAL